MNRTSSRILVVLAMAGLAIGIGGVVLTRKVKAQREHEASRRLNEDKELIKRVTAAVRIEVLRARSDGRINPTPAFELEVSDNRLGLLKEELISAIEVGRTEYPKAPHIISRWQFLVHGPEGDPALVVVVRLNTLEIDGVFFPYKRHMELAAILQED